MSDPRSPFRVSRRTVFQVAYVYEHFFPFRRPSNTLVCGQLLPLPTTCKNCMHAKHAKTAKHTKFGTSMPIVQLYASDMLSVHAKMR